MNQLKMKCKFPHPILNDFPLSLKSNLRLPEGAINTTISKIKFMKYINTPQIPKLDR